MVKMTSLVTRTDRCLNFNSELDVAGPRPRPDHRPHRHAGASRPGHRGGGADHGAGEGPCRFRGLTIITLRLMP
jgi:hypothetical protein